MRNRRGPLLPLVAAASCVLLLVAQAAPEGKSLKDDACGECCYEDDDTCLPCKRFGYKCDDDDECCADPHFGCQSKMCICREYSHWNGHECVLHEDPPTTSMPVAEKKDILGIVIGSVTGGLILISATLIIIQRIRIKRRTRLNAESNARDVSPTAPPPEFIPEPENPYVHSKAEASSSGQHQVSSSDLPPPSYEEAIAK